MLSSILVPPSGCGEVSVPMRQRSELRELTETFRTGDGASTSSEAEVGPIIRSWTGTERVGSPVSSARSPLGPSMRIIGCGETVSKGRGCAQEAVAVLPLPCAPCSSLA